jgi:hypothetical protein
LFISGDSVLTALWQFIQTFNDGIEAFLDLNAPVWQYWHSIFMAPACNFVRVFNRLYRLVTLVYVGVPHGNPAPAAHGNGTAKHYKEYQFFIFQQPFLQRS